MIWSHFLYISRILLGSPCFRADLSCFIMVAVIMPLFHFDNISSGILIFCKYCLIITRDFQRRFQTSKFFENLKTPIFVPRGTIKLTFYARLCLTKPKPKGWSWFHFNMGVLYSISNHDPWPQINKTQWCQAVPEQSWTISFKKKFNFKSIEQEDGL